ncbi:FecCD family ABC transporter permease [Glutamicibacter endophyticus]
MSTTMTRPAPRTRARMRTRRDALIWAALILLGATLAVLYVLAGREPLPLDEVAAVLRGETVPGTSFILLEDRAPRLVVGALAGAGFGASGALFQRWLGNPLASPDVIGVGYGASAAAIIAMVYFQAQGPMLTLTAMLGGLGIAGLIYWLSAGGKHAGAKLILAGLAIGGMLQSLIQYLLTRTDVRTAGEALRWLTGSLAPSTWERAAVMAIGLALVALLVPLVLKRLKIMELGDDAASALGLNVPASRMLLVFTAVTLTAIPVAVTGPLAFVAFLAGPLSAGLTRGVIRVPLAALIGAVLVLGANFIAANLFSGVALPVGVVTGIFGAPFLLWVLVRANSRGNGG